MKSKPPSFCISTPKKKRWEKIAPKIVPNPKIAPINVVLGIMIKMEISSSIMPIPILPYGSKPNSEKIQTLSGAPVNLKNKVCKRSMTIISFVINGI